MSWWKRLRVRLREIRCGLRFAFMKSPKIYVDAPNEHVEIKWKEPGKTIKHAMIINGDIKMYQFNDPIPVSIVARTDAEFLLRKLAASQPIGNG